MNVYELLAASTAISIRVVSGETFYTRDWSLDDDERWLSIRPFEKRLDGQTYPMRKPHMALNIAHIVWIAEAGK